MRRGVKNLSRAIVCFILSYAGSYLLRFFDYASRQRTLARGTERPLTRGQSQICTFTPAASVRYTSSVRPRAPYLNPLSMFVRSSDSHSRMSWQRSCSYPFSSVAPAVRTTLDTAAHTNATRMGEVTMKIFIPLETRTHLASACMCDFRRRPRRSGSPVRVTHTMIFEDVVTPSAWNDSPDRAQWHFKN